MAAAPASLCITALNAAMSATSMLRPTWLGLLGSTNVLMLLATEPKTCSRLGDDNQCATSSTSWVAMSLGIGVLHRGVIGSVRAVPMAVLSGVHSRRYSGLGGGAIAPPGTRGPRLGNAQADPGAAVDRGALTSPRSGPKAAATAPVIPPAAGAVAKHSHAEMRSPAIQRPAGVVS